MSEDDKLLAMGRAGQEYAEIKQKLAALLAEAQRMGRALNAIGRYLAPFEDHSHGSLKGSGKIPELADYPTADQIRDVITEAQAADKRKRELHQTLKEFGFEPKD